MPETSMFSMRSIAGVVIAGRDWFDGGTGITLRRLEIRVIRRGHP
jgi:hypothetical protein